MLERSRRRQSKIEDHKPNSTELYRDIWLILGVEGDKSIQSTIVSRQSCTLLQTISECHGTGQACTIMRTEAENNEISHYSDAAKFD
jgi:hypothetical protein